MYTGDEFYGDEITSGPDDDFYRQGNPYADPEAVDSSAKPECVLVGTDGNVFSIIGKVSRTLKRAGQGDAAAEFSRRAMDAGSYDEVLRLCFEYVDVT
jgi:hypothetical protein